MSSFRYDNVSTMPCDTMLCLVMHKTGRWDIRRVVVYNE